MFPNHHKITTKIPKKIKLNHFFCLFQKGRATGYHFTLDISETADADELS
jgi:hypothetical protein